MMGIAKYIDHTLLKPEAKREDIDRLIEECKKYKFYGCCVNPYWVKYVSDLLANEPTFVCSVVGFPLGASKTQIKVEEAVRAVEDGAEEIDMVMNIGAFKDKDYKYVEREIKEMKKEIEDKILKVIIETPLLTSEEIKVAAKLCINAGADFVKTCTGFGKRGVTEEDVKLIREAIGTRGKIKASGGIRTFEFAKKLIELGAERLGTSAGVQIVEQEK